MKTILTIIVVATIVLVAVGLLGANQTRSGTIGFANGATLPGLIAKADTPEQAVTNLLNEVQKRHWDEVYGALSKTSGVDEQSFREEWQGKNGSLRTFSNLEGSELRPLHATNDDAQIRARLRWTTPIGPIEDVHDFQLIREGGLWKVVWPKQQVANVPAQVVPVTYLRWDLVSGDGKDEWGARNIDPPHVRIVSMNAVNSAEGSVVMGEVVNEDTVPAFVNVNATLVDGAGNPIDDENSFDKIDHVLLPKQITPYRIDFPGIDLSKVKNVRMDIKASLVPASADPVIGVMNQKIDADVQGRSVLRGELFNQSGQTVNIPHVIASFYDNNGKVIWVSDGYVDLALRPETSEPFSVDIPRSLAGKVQSFHVVVNQYSLGKS
ncbi:MAG TPA: hypothetical protein VK828_20130 [Terriglobales bacterium]|jgi:hypothetical protein|nr:hypothetical protein [Terriglobales bacterium]